MKLYVFESAFSPSKMQAARRHGPEKIGPQASIVVVDVDAAQQ